MRAVLPFILVGFLAACSTPAARPAQEAAPAAALRSTEANETAVPIQERFQLLGTAEREISSCMSVRLPPPAGGDRTPRRECVDLRYPPAAPR